MPDKVVPCIASFSTNSFPPSFFPNLNAIKDEIILKMLERHDAARGDAPRFTSSFDVCIPLCDGEASACLILCTTESGKMAYVEFYENGTDYRKTELYTWSCKRSERFPELPDIENGVCCNPTCVQMAHDVKGLRVKRCARCKRATYCCKACQKDHWRAGHKQACVAMPSTRARCATPCLENAP